MGARFDLYAPSAPEGLDVPKRFDSIRFRAFVHLEIGPEAYREGDTLGFPPAEGPESKLDAVKSGCEQLLLWKGLTPEVPLEGIGVDGFDALLRMFHFNHVSHEVYAAARPDHLLDRIVMRHVIDGWEVTLYNLVKARGVKEPEPPCPYCGDTSEDRKSETVLGLQG